MGDIKENINLSLEMCTALKFRLEKHVGWEGSFFFFSLKHLLIIMDKHIVNIHCKYSYSVLKPFVYIQFNCGSICRVPTRFLML